MSTFKKILKSLPGQRQGTGIDISDLVGPELFDKDKGDNLVVGTLLDTATEKIKPEAFVAGQKDNIGAYLSSGGKDKINAGLGYLTKDKKSSVGLGVNKTDKSKNIMFGLKSEFSKGGSVELKKGKDYIKDLI